VTKPPEFLSEICTVPGTDIALSVALDGRARSEEGHQFEALRGVPVLRALEPAPREIRPDHVSQPIAQERIDYMCGLSGLTLMLGGGASPFQHPSVVDVEFDLYPTTDLIADAHALPFHSDTFELFFAMNVFEHLREPARAAQEALRVLKPGGEVLIHTAFLQPLHEAPRHFYNATEFGVREWFRDFDAVDCTVSGNFNPIYAVSWLAQEILHAAETELGHRAAGTLGELRLAELARFWSDPTGWNPEALEAFFQLPEPVQHRAAAGFELHARKPTR